MGAIERIGGLALRHVRNEALALFAAPRRDAGAGEANQWQKVLADSSRGPPNRLREHRADLPRLSCVGDLLGGNAVKHPIAEHGEPDPGPPRQHGNEIHEVLNGACLVGSCHAGFLTGAMTRASLPPALQARRCTIFSDRGACVAAKRWRPAYPAINLFTLLAAQ